MFAVLSSCLKISSLVVLSLKDIQRNNRLASTIEKAEHEVHHEGKVTRWSLISLGDNSAMLDKGHVSPHQ